MRFSPLLLTIILAVLTGALSIAVWAPISGHFNAPGTPGGVNNTTDTGLTDFQKMARYMPLPPTGWSLNNTTGGMAIDDPDSFSYARNDYTKPGSNETASVLVYDSDGQNILWNSIFNTGFIYDDGGGYAKVYSYKGMPAWETGRYSNDGNVYSMYIKLSYRFGIAILLKCAEDSSALRDFADRINVYRIISLGKATE
jgi:hypothetical protein